MQGSYKSLVPNKHTGSAFQGNEHLCKIQDGLMLMPGENDLQEINACMVF